MTELQLEYINTINSIIDLIGDPNKWTQDQLAFKYPEDQYSCSPFDEKAYCWCLIGAAKKVNPKFVPSLEEYRGYTPEGKMFFQFLDTYIPEFTGAREKFKYLPIYEFKTNVANFNDYAGTTHKDIIDFLEHCKAELEKRDGIG